MSGIDSKINKPYCSFCGKGQDEVQKLIAGPSVFICNECVDLCSGILKESSFVNKGVHTSNLSCKPKEIERQLNEYIIGQDDAKKALAVAVYNHYKRISYVPSGKDTPEISKSNILLIGPTGCGKTLFAQTLAKILDVPFAIADATGLTEAGYVGDDVENIILKLLQNADYNKERAERGIIYIDEIDKITRKSDTPSITRDVSGEGVQQALLKIIEGTVASVPPQGGRKHPQKDYIQIDTTNILFICGGAFDGLERVIASRKKGLSIGFGADIKTHKEAVNTDLFKDVEVEDLVKFGMIPEFIGRLPVMVSLNKLSQEELKHVLLTPKNALIRQYQQLFEIDNIDLKFTDGAIKEIVNRALENKSGARGLRSIIERSLIDIMFEAPSIDYLEEVTIDEGVIKGTKKPNLKIAGNKAPKKQKASKPQIKADSEFKKFKRDKSVVN